MHCSRRILLLRPVIAFSLMVISLLASAPAWLPVRTHAQFNDIDLSAPDGASFSVASNSTLTVTLRAVNQLGIDIVGIRLNRVDGLCAAPGECPSVLLTDTVPSSLDSFGTPADIVMTFQVPAITPGTTVVRSFTFTLTGRHFEDPRTGIPPLSEQQPGVLVPTTSNPLVITISGMGPVLPTLTPIAPTPTHTPDGATPPPPTPTPTPSVTPPVFLRRLWLPALLRDSGLEIEPNNHAGQAMAIAAQRALNGRFNDQYDVYHLVMTSQGPVIIDLLGYPGTMAGRVQLQLYYGDLLLASRRDQAVSPPYRIAHTGPAGIYYIVVYTDPAFINANVGYQLLASYAP